MIWIKRKINQQKEEIIQLENKIEELKLEIKNQEMKKDELAKDILTKQEAIGFLYGIIEMDEIGISYDPKYKNLDEIEAKICEIKENIALLLGREEVIIVTRDYYIDKSFTKGERFQKEYCSNLLIGFNSIFNKKLKTVTKENLYKTEEYLKGRFEKFNKKANLLGIRISEKYLSYCLELIRLELDKKISKQEEKDRIREEKRKLKEQEKFLIEAEKAKLELQKQRRMYEQSLAKALNEQERQEFEAKLKEIDKREADVDYRINNSKAGYLYITATKAMPNMTKLGVTRRLNPLVRIQELSSAATPYPFVCYGLVFSDNAFDLETRIHEYFDNKRVNQENKHKEFFYITPQEAIKVLKEEFGCDVHFVNEEREDEE